MIIHVPLHIKGVGFNECTYRVRSQKEEEERVFCIEMLMKMDVFDSIFFRTHSCGGWWVGSVVG